MSMLNEGDLLWTPGPQRMADSHLTAFVDWLQRERALTFADYNALWRWSVEDLDGFWASIWDYFEVQCSAPYRRVLGRREMPGAEWFPGARLNYAEHVLLRAGTGPDSDDAKTALLYLSESTPLSTLSADELAASVRILATELRRLGIQPGDRLVAYMPNIPQAVIAMLATTSIGAIWASCSPDFGTRGVLDRLQQLAPKLIFVVDGYRYGGKAYRRKTDVGDIIDRLESLEHVVYLPYLDPHDLVPPRPGALLWQDLLARPAVAGEDFRFEQVPFAQPLWILFSSGTTGLPKAIVHCHGGILLEMLKLLHLHMDLHARDRMFFFTTTGWMMWNFLVSGMLAGVCPVLYDGHPAYPQPDVLWRMVEQSGTNFFGASPAYVEGMVKAGVVPRDRVDLASLNTVMLAGSPVSAECAAWFYRNVKDDLWVAPGSGGTDICSGFVGGVPTLPVYAGEIQARSLGVAAYAFNDSGASVTDELGELVIAKPMPSMPVGFWNDSDDQRYRESYFDEFPGVWRQGDFFRINQRGGCFVLGRSDAVLNRHGVRIGTAEIYRVLAALDEIDDALVVNLDLPGGRFFMPLFVKLSAAITLDAALEEKIRASLRREYSPRHVPDKIYQVAAIPVTLTGKKMEVPVRKILLGVALDKAANRNAMAQPQSLDYFVDYARHQQDYRLS